MKRYVIPIVILLVLASGVLVGCGKGLQTFNKYGISFEVSRDLKLEEYTVSLRDLIFRKGSASYEEGTVSSTEKNFMFIWLKTVPKFTPEETRLSILSTPDTFVSAIRTFKAEITGDLVTQHIGGFEVTFARMRFTLPGWKATGVTAVWYSPASQRTMQLIAIHKQPEREMERFIRSFSDSGIVSPVSQTPASKVSAAELEAYLGRASPIMNPDNA